MLKREEYLARIRPYYDGGLIKLITGVRRAGKSVLLSQIADELRIGEAGNVVEINLEDYDYREFWNNPKDFHDYLKREIEKGQGKKNYVLLDEIQHVKDFENVLASLKATTDVSLFATGSCSTLLSGALASRLTGRVIEFPVRPFSYRECLSYTDGNTDLEEYLRLGGMPLRFQAPDEKGALKIVRDIFQSIIEKDIYPTLNGTFLTTFDNFARYILQSSGNCISLKSLSGYITAYDQKTSAPTLYSYLRKLNESYLVQAMDRYDIMGKKELSYLQKQYAIDPAFITIAKAGNNEEGMGFALETAIANELKNLGFDTYVGKLPRGEVDFIAKDQKGVRYIQVATYMESVETRKREFGALLKIRDNYPKYVISMDREDFSQNGIIHIRAEDFLSGRAVI